MKWKLVKIAGVHFEKIEFRSKNPLKIINSLMELHKIIVKNRIDIVHCHHRIAGLFMALYNTIWSIPYIWTLHLAPIQCDFIHRMLTSYGSKAIAVSYEVGEFLNKNLRIPKRDIVYVLNGVDESKLKLVTSNEKIKLKKQIGIPDDKK